MNGEQVSAMCTTVHLTLYSKIRYLPFFFHAHPLRILTCRKKTYTDTIDHMPTLSKTCCSSHTCCSLTLPVTWHIISIYKAPPGVWYVLHVLTFKSKYPIKKQEKEKENLQRSLTIAANFCWWRTVMTVLSKLLERNVSRSCTQPLVKCLCFKGFLVSKLFTSETLHIYTGIKEVGVMQG